MSDDRLARATRALREQHEGSSPEAEATRARVLSALDGARVLKLADHARPRRAAWLALLAATMAVATAWGATEGRLGAFWGRLGGASEQGKPVSPATRTSASAPAVGFPAGDDALEASAAPPPGTAAVVAEAPPTEPSAPPAPTSTKRIPASAEADADTLYERAHRLQSSGADLAAAVSAWDAYLSRAPNGSFCLEARFDRAIDLVHLGRTSQARTALEPFARGDYGAYRRADARALLATLPP